MKEKGRLEWKERAREWAILVPDRTKLFQFLSEPSERKNEEKEFRSVEESGAEEESPIEDRSPKEDRNAARVPQHEPPEEESISVDPSPMEREILSEAVSDKILYDAEEVLGSQSAFEKEKGEEKTMGNEASEEEAREEEKGATKSSRPFSQWLDPNSASSGPEEEKEGNKEGELIDRFIQKEEEGPVKPNQQERTEFFSSERMARKSTDESQLPVSETLAELYVTQGDIQKAIEAFEKLRLKFPEKSDYFADRVRELKDRSKR